MIFGCSSFTWETGDGRHLLGRTYDQFGDLRANRILAAAPGEACRPGLRGGFAEPGRYGYTGMAVTGFGEPIVVDGVNSGGLMGALLHYPEYAGYPKGAGDGPAVHPGRLLAWLLSRCAGVEEAVEALWALTLTDEPVQGKALPAHYLLSDRGGEAVVVEPERDGLHIYRGTIGVLANSPGYLWQRTNLRNYTGVSNLPQEPRTVAGLEIREFGERMGRGGGLPGGYGSPARFVRTAFMKEFALPGRDELDGVSRMFRAFAPVEIPEGLAGTDPGGAYEQTLCISVMCAESGVYYFAPAWNRRISAVRPLPEGSRTRFFDLGATQDVDYRN